MYLNILMEVIIWKKRFHRDWILSPEEFLNKSSVGQFALRLLSFFAPSSFLSTYFGCSNLKSRPFLCLIFVFVMWFFISCFWAMSKAWQIMFCIKMFAYQMCAGGGFSGILLKGHQWWTMDGGRCISKECVMVQLKMFCLYNIYLSNTCLYI